MPVSSKKRSRSRTIPTLTLDLFQEIIRFIPYSKQGPIRRTCKALSELNVTEFHACQLPDIPEIAKYMFSAGDKPMFKLVFGDRTGIDIFWEDKSKHATYKSKEGILLSIRPTNDGWWSATYENKYFPTPRDLICYLRNFDMVCSNKLQLSTEFLYWETLRNILCQRSYCQVCNSGSYLIKLIRQWSLKNNKISTYIVTEIKKFLIPTSKLHRFELGEWNATIDNPEIIDCIKELSASDFIQN